MCFSTGQAKATLAPVGVFSYDTFIPAGGGSPGITAFNVSNLTGVWALPPDFPVVGSLTFQSASLTLTWIDLSQQVFMLGNIGPGFLLDSGGNPVVQVPADQLFNSAEFTATLTASTFSTYDGSVFSANSTAVDVTLLPSSGSTLVADIDGTTIEVAGSVEAAAPEPSFYGFLMVAITLMAGIVRVRRI
jgi:hypothetical protein